MIQGLLCSTILIHFAFVVCCLWDLRCSGRESNGFRHEALSSVPASFTEVSCWVDTECLVDDHITFLKKLPFLSPVAEWVRQSWGSAPLPLTKDGWHDPALDITMPHYSGDNTWAKDVAIDPAGPIWGYHWEWQREAQTKSFPLHDGWWARWIFLSGFTEQANLCCKWWDQYT